MSISLSKAIPLGLRKHLDTRVFVTAQLLTVNPATRRATVSINNGPAVSLPYSSMSALDNFSTFTTVLVGRDGTGQQYVLGGLGVQSAETKPAPPPPDVPSTESAKTTIRPTDSGTYSTKWNRYYAWNVGRYGGSSTLYQSQAFGSQLLLGIALYGKQIKALKAVSIDSAVLHVPLLTGSGTVQVQGDSRSSLSGQPTPSGATASGKGTITLGSTLRANLASGSVNALVLVGSDYLAVSGNGSGMALSITYTRNT